MRLVLALLLCLMAVPVLAQSVDDQATSGVKVRAYLEPEGEIYVGQLARLWVEVSTATWFSKAPRYPELKLPGAIALMPEQLGVNFSEQVGGETRAGQRQRYVIIPQRPGELVIPSLAITLSVAIDGKPSDPIKVQTQPVKMAVVFPDGAKDLDRIITTNKLSVSESYDREFAGLKVGDAVTRTVTVKSENTFALALPQTEFKPATGARVYPAQPRLSDKVNRGRYRAERSDAATYVFENQGTTALPEIMVQWWNPDSKTVEQTVLPAVSFTVAANPDFAATPAPADRGTSPIDEAKRWLVSGLIWLRTNIVWLTFAAIGLYVVTLVWQRLQPELMARWQSYRDRRRQSEASAFSAFRQACRSHSDAWMVNAFWQWLDRLRPGDQAASLDHLLRQVGDKNFDDFIHMETRTRYGPANSQRSDGDVIYRQIARFRQRVIGRHRQTASLDQNSLNPRPVNHTKGLPDARAR